MDFLMMLLKFLIIFLTILYIWHKLKSTDTSALYDFLTENSKNFSPKNISKMERYFKKLSVPFNIATISSVLAVGVLAFLIVLFITKQIFTLNSVRYIISIPFLFTGMIVLELLAEYKQERMEEGLSDFFIQLKSALKVNPEIIEALRRIQNNVLEPFSTYTKQLLNEINAGKLPEDALESFAHKIGIEKFSLYINNVRYCHIYGGDITLLTEKTQEVISEAIKQKKKRNKETKSACTVLYVLIVIDFYMYFSFIASNQYYLDLMSKTFIGQTIVNINFICVWVMILLSKQIKKLDY